MFYPAHQTVVEGAPQVSKCKEVEMRLDFHKELHPQLKVTLVMDTLLSIMEVQVGRPLHVE